MYRFLGPFITAFFPSSSFCRVVFSFGFYFLFIAFIRFVNISLNLELNPNGRRRDSKERYRFVASLLTANFIRIIRFIVGSLRSASQTKQTQYHYLSIALNDTHSDVIVLKWAINMFCGIDFCLSLSLPFHFEWNRK